MPCAATAGATLALVLGRFIPHSMRGNPERGGRTRLPSPVPQNRFLLKLQPPMEPSEVRRIERWLATARLALAISALFAVWMGPTPISWWAQWLLGIYIIHGIVVMLMLRGFANSRPRSFDF